MHNSIFKTGCILAWLLFSGCSKEMPVPVATPQTSSLSMSNDWWVTLKVGTTDLIGTHIHFATYNTTENDDSLWLDDLANGYGMKCKVKRDIQRLSFLTASSHDEYKDVNGNDVQVTITNGKILHNGGISKTGIATDSIYLEAIFTDDPSTTYIISGTARTRWLDDDY